MLLFSFPFPARCGAAVLLLLAALPAAGQTPDSAAVVAASGPPAGSGTLLKLGTGFTRGLALGGYRGFRLPLVLGAEHHLTPAVSVFVNAFSGLNVGRRYVRYDGFRESLFGDSGFDAGVRYYYSQQKRRQKGRAAGPFTGNYLALQSTSVYNPNDFYRSYQYSTLTAVWGMQRRLGKYGWFDAYVGAGIGREPSYAVSPGYRSSRRYVPAPEIGIKLNLGTRLTR